MDGKSTGQFSSTGTLRSTQHTSVRTRKYDLGGDPSYAWETSCNTWVPKYRKVCPSCGKKKHTRFWGAVALAVSDLKLTHSVVGPNGADVARSHKVWFGPFTSAHRDCYCIPDIMSATVVTVLPSPPSDLISDTGEREQN